MSSLHVHSEKVSPRIKRKKQVAKAKIEKPARMRLSNDTPKPTSAPSKPTVDTTHPPKPATHETPSTVPEYTWRDKKVEIIRPATQQDSGYIEGEDQVIIKHHDDNKESLAWRKEVVPIEPTEPTV